MTTTTTDAHGATNGGAASGATPLPTPLLQVLIEALDDGDHSLADLLDGRGGTALIKTLLARSQLSAEQQSVVELLTAFDGKGDGNSNSKHRHGRANGQHHHHREHDNRHSDNDNDDENIVDVDPIAESIATAEPGTATAPLPSNRQVDWRELRDLRLLNDTLAAALGACRVCWGGDRGCDVCGGRGRAGFARPDLDLFDELVAPALKRVVAMRRAGRPDPDRNRR